MQESTAQPTLTYLPTTTLEDLIKRAKTADLLEDKINALEQQNKAILERLANHAGRIVALEMDLDTMRAKEPGQADTARVQKLIRYMKGRPDHKASFATLRGVLQVNACQLRAVIKAADKLDPGRFEAKDDSADKRKSWLFEKR